MYGITLYIFVIFPDMRAAGVLNEKVLSYIPIDINCNTPNTDTLFNLVDFYFIYFKFSQLFKLVLFIYTKQVYFIFVKTKYGVSTKLWSNSNIYRHGNLPAWVSVYVTIITSQILVF